MKKYKLAIFSMILVMMFVTGCEEESTDPPEYSNGLLITLSEKKYDARENVNCSKDLSNIITLTAKNSKEEVWVIEFLWDTNAQDGDTVFISESNRNTIKLSSPIVGDYYTSSSNPKADETFVKVLEYTDGVKIKAEIDGYIYKSGTTSEDSLKDGYFITTNFD